MADAFAVVNVGNSECEFGKLTPSSRIDAIVGAVSGADDPGRATRRRRRERDYAARPRPPGRHKPQMPCTTQHRKGRAVSSSSSIPCRRLDASPSRRNLRACPYAEARHEGKTYQKRWQNSMPESAIAAGRARAQASTMLRTSQAEVCYRLATAPASCRTTMAPMRPLRRVGRGTSERPITSPGHGLIMRKAPTVTKSVA